MNEPWRILVRELKRQGHGYFNIYKILKDIYPDLTESKCRRESEKAFLPKYVNELVNENIPVIEDKKEKKKEINLAPSYSVVKEAWEGGKIVKFGLVSDTHFGSKHQQLTHLNTAYDIFKERGIETVYHAGDITEGIKMRKGHEYECFLHGVDEVEEYVVANYPKRDGIITKFITGNHDLSMIKIGGVDIGKRIDARREDMIYLGQLNAKIYLTPNCTMELNHPLDGSSYAYSYATQKYIDSMQGGSKPNILATGHHHKFFILDYRNVQSIEIPAFQSQTSWMRGKRLPAHMGFLIITVEVAKDGTIKRFVPEYYPFYETKERDY